MKKLKEKKNQSSYIIFNTMKLTDENNNIKKSISIQRWRSLNIIGSIIHLFRPETRNPKPVTEILVLGFQ